MVSGGWREGKENHEHPRELKRCKGPISAKDRRTSGEFVQFLSHAEGSLAELETQILIVVDLDLSTEEANQALAQIEELQRMLNSLRQKLATRH